MPPITWSGSCHNFEMIGLYQNPSRSHPKAPRALQVTYIAMQTFHQHIMSNGQQWKNVIAPDRIAERVWGQIPEGWRVDRWGPHILFLSPSYPSLPTAHKTSFGVMCRCYTHTHVPYPALIAWHPWPHHHMMPLRPRPPPRDASDFPTAVTFIIQILHCSILFLYSFFQTLYFLFLSY